MKAIYCWARPPTTAFAPKKMAERRAIGHLPGRRPRDHADHGALLPGSGGVENGERRGGESGRGERGEKGRVCLFVL